MKRSVFSWQNFLLSLGRKVAWNRNPPLKSPHRKPIWESLEPRLLLASVPISAEGEGPFSQIIWLQAEGNTFDTNVIQNGIGYGGVQYVPGVLGQAFNLDGINDEVRITREYPKNSEGSSYSFWFKRDIGGPIIDRNLLAFRGKGGSGWGLVSKSTGAIEFKLDSLEQIKKPIFTSDILDNGWHFVTLCVNDALQQVTVQIDSGTEVLRNYRGQIPAAWSGYTTVGASAFGVSWFDGRIDELRIIDLAVWNVRRSPSEVL